MKNIKEKLSAWFSAKVEDEDHDDSPRDVRDVRDVDASIALLNRVTAHMLIHLARVDGSTGQEEVQVIRDILMHAFDNTPAEADSTIQQAIDEAEQHEDWYRHLRHITGTIEREERMELLRHLWMVVLADGRIDSYEANFMRRIGSLLGISDKDVNATRIHLQKANN